MTLIKDDDPRLASLRVCMVLAHDASMRSSAPELVSSIDSLVARCLSEEIPAPRIREAVRDMLRAGGYKPSGRQKPASEYLAQAAREGRFPFINSAVDCNNLLSLETGFPISLLDAAAFHDGGSDGAAAAQALLRVAGPGERYIFNASGHEMDLAGLACICSSSGRALGNPVKDSMQGKLKDASTDFAGFIFAPAALVSSGQLATLGERFASLLRDYCGAGECTVTVL